MSEERSSVRSRVVISNYWHKPGIQCKVFYNESSAPAGAIELTIFLDDFLKSIASEMAPRKWFKPYNNAIEVVEAASRALEKIKESSTAVMVGAQE